MVALFRLFISLLTIISVVATSSTVESEETESIIPALLRKLDTKISSLGLRPRLSSTTSSLYYALDASGNTYSVENCYMAAANNLCFVKHDVRGAKICSSRIAAGSVTAIQVDMDHQLIHVIGVPHQVGGPFRTDGKEANTMSESFLASTCSLVVVEHLNENGKAGSTLLPSADDDTHTHPTAISTSSTASIGGGTKPPSPGLTKRKSAGNNNNVLNGNSVRLRGSA